MSNAKKTTPAAINKVAAPMKAFFGEKAPPGVDQARWDKAEMARWDVPAEMPVPEIKVHHFDPMVLKVMSMVASPLTPRKNLYLYGVPGAGKTSSILQFAARYNIPTWSMSCSGKTKFEDMLFVRDLVGGNTVVSDGPLLKAWRHGGIFNPNELSRMDNKEQMRLVEFLDGLEYILVPGTNETVYQHPDFRLMGTGNSSGFGDETGAYPGETVASGAFFDRFISMEVKPLDEASEVALVAEKAPSVPIDVVRGMVALARAVRDSFVGTSGKAKAGAPLSFSISPRALCDWALTTQLTQQMHGIKDPVFFALELIVLNGKPQECTQVVTELYNNWMKGSSKP